MYHVECDCGQLVAVELFQAGATVECKGCEKPIPVPSLSSLKQSTGDSYPHLSALDKVLATSAAHEPPFDGTCHRCADELAELQTMIAFNRLTQRAEQGESGIRLTLDGIRFVAAAAEEQWQCVTFPLLLCGHCHSTFQREKKRAAVVRLVKNTSVFGLLVGFLCFAWNSMEVVAAFAGILTAIGAAAWILRFQNTRKGQLFVLPWLRRIRWVPEAISSESEFRLVVGPTAPYEAPEPSKHGTT